MGVFEEFHAAWRQAVTNFWAELEAGEAGDPSRALYREVGRVRDQLVGVDAAMSDTKRRLREERERAEACARRERMARDIGDEETARIAAEYRERHEERADVLARKLEALEAERRLCARDLKEMELALQADHPVDVAPELDDLNQHPREAEFRNLEAAERGRSAEERLEDLKRRMGR